MTMTWKGAFFVMATLFALYVVASYYYFESLIEDMNVFREMAPEMLQLEAGALKERGEPTQALTYFHTAALLATLRNDARGAGPYIGAANLLLEEACLPLALKEAEIAARFLDDDSRRRAPNTVETKTHLIDLSLLHARFAVAKEGLGDHDGALEHATLAEQWNPFGHEEERWLLHKQLMGDEYIPYSLLLAEAQAPEKESVTPLN